MSAIHWISIASFGFVAWFTWHQISRKDSSDGQSRRDSIVEAWVNILVGFSINFVANLVILPLAGLHIELLDNFLIGWIYTAVSIVRQYAIRRWFNQIFVRSTATASMAK